jgi:hypothetical protein
MSPDSPLIVTRAFHLDPLISKAEGGRLQIVTDEPNTIKTCHLTNESFESDHSSLAQQNTESPNLCPQAKELLERRWFDERTSNYSLYSGQTYPYIPLINVSSVVPQHSVQQRSKRAFDGDAPTTVKRPPASAIDRV